MFSKKLLDRALPRAFTFLGTNLAFSIIGSALTFYPEQSISRLAVVSLLSQITQDPDLKHYPVIHNDLEHDHYHLDTLDIKNRHYHLHFYQNLDKLVLSKFLDYFVMVGHIEEFEKQQCLDAFAEANTIPTQEFEQIMTLYNYEHFQRLLLIYYSKPAFTEIIPDYESILDDISQLIDNNISLSEARRYMNTLKKIVEDSELQEDSDEITALIEPFSKLFATINPDHINQVIEFFANVTAINADEFEASHHSKVSR